MSEIQYKYSKAFKRMCHFVALRKDPAPLTEVQDSLIRTAIYLSNNSLAKSLIEIDENLKGLFSLEFSADEIRASIERLETRGDIAFFDDRGIKISDSAIAIVEESIASSRELEEVVKEEWFNLIRNKSALGENHLNDAWLALQDYLAQMFVRHGVQTLEFIAPEEVEEGFDRPTTHFLEEAVRKHLQGVKNSVAKAVIRSFFESKTPNRVKYLAQLLDGTFAFFALTVDEQSSALLRSALPHLKLFVDTNFIFGLLDLHSNPFVTVSKELIRTIQRERFPFDLYFHPLTLKEYKGTLRYFHRHLKNEDREWSPTLSKAILRVSGLSGVEANYHLLNSETQTSVDDFFAPFYNAQRILQNYGIKVFNGKFEHLLDDEMTLDVMSKYKRFLEDIKKDKSLAAVEHDVMLWRILKEIRGNDLETLSAGAFFLSCDYKFWRFDQKYLTDRHEVGTVVLPNVMLQIIRPFVPRTDDFDTGFVETFRLPEFRTIHSANTKAITKVASIVNLYSNFDEDLAVALLSDEVLLSKVREIDEDDEKVRELIELSVAEEANNLRKVKKSLEKQIEQQKERYSKLEDATLTLGKKSAEKLDEAKRDREAVQNKLKELTEKLVRVTSQLENQENLLSTAREEMKKVGFEKDGLQEKVVVLSKRLKARDQEIQHLKEKRGRLIRGGIQLLFAMITGVVVLSLFNEKLNTTQTVAVITGCALYGVFTALFEQLNWLNTRKMPAVLRILWLLFVASLVLLTFDLRFLGIAAPVFVGLITTSGHKKDQLISSMAEAEREESSKIVQESNTSEPSDLST